MKPTTSEVTLFNHEEQASKSEPLVMVRKRDQQTLIPANQASQELVRIKGQFPFDLFPDELIVEEKRLVIKRRVFPFYVTTLTIPLSKVTMFEVTHSILFSSLYIKGFIGSNLETTFQWLSHTAAQKVKDIVDGLRLKDSESIDVLEHEKEHRIYTLERLGHVF